MPQIRKPVNVIKRWQGQFTTKPLLRNKRPDLVKKHSRHSPVLNKNHIPKLPAFKSRKRTKA